MSALRFSHVALNCKNQAETEKFYTEHFGFRRARVVDVGAEQIIFLKCGDAYLELFASKGDAPIAPPMNDGYAWSKRLLGVGTVPLWLGVGVGGLWPLSLPWQVRIRQRIGQAIDLAPLRARHADDERFVSTAHALVTGTLQSMLDELRRERAATREAKP